MHNYTILTSDDLTTVADIAALRELPNHGDIVLSEHNGIFRVLYAIHDTRKDVSEPSIYLVCEEIGTGVLKGFAPADEIARSSVQ